MMGDAINMKRNKTGVLSNNLYMLKILHKASRWRLFLESMFHIAKGLVQTLIYTVLFGNIVKALEHGYGFRRITMFIGLIALITGVLLLYETWFLDVFLKYDNNRIQQYIMKNIFNHASKLDIKQYEDPEFYNKYVRTLDEANNRCIKLSGKVGEFIGTFTTTVFLMSIIISVDSNIIVLAFLPIISSYILGKRKNKIDYDLYMSNTKPLRKAQYVNRVMYMGQYAKDIKVSNISRCLLDMYDDSMDQVISNHKNYSLRSSLYKLSMDVIADNFINICILIYISYRIVVSKTLVIGDYLIVQNAVVSVTWRIQWLVNSYLQFEQFSMYIDNFKTFMDTKSSAEISQSHREVDKSNNMIEFKNVSFSYDGKNTVLENVNLTINKGEKIAIVGHNGAGKSTLIKLLLRLYETRDGEILFNGININEYSLDKYRKVFSTIFQDFCLYAFNIGENITTQGTCDKDKPDIFLALQKSDMLERVKQLPKGIETSVTKEFDEDGFSPSGGESQKLAIARAIYRNSEVFIMDEPSSALDPLAEAKINELMMNSSQDKTVVLISHRLSSTMKADRILLLNQGRITESGTHAELMELKGLYADMFTKQAENYHMEENIA